METTESTLSEVGVGTSSEATRDTPTATGVEVDVGVGTLEGIPVAPEIEIALPQDKGKGVDILKRVEKPGMKTTYKRKHVGQRSLKGWLSKVIEEEEGDPQT